MGAVKFKGQKSSLDSRIQMSLTLVLWLKVLLRRTVILSLGQIFLHPWIALVLSTILIFAAQDPFKNLELLRISEDVKIPRISSMIYMSTGAQTRHLIIR